jgi:hypothetical protein
MAAWHEKKQRTTDIGLGSWIGNRAEARLPGAQVMPAGGRIRDRSRLRLVPHTCGRRVT